MLAAVIGAAAVAAAGDGWQVSCRAGTDEYASNCDAVLRDGPFRVAIVTGDSQVFLTVEVPDCKAEDKAMESNWWRTDLTVLSTSRRDARLRGAIARAVAGLRHSCPEAVGAPLRLGALPDIAVHGDP